MNWFKKQFNKLFSSDIEEEEYYEEEQFDEVPINEQTQEQKRSSFRFPLIEDSGRQDLPPKQTDVIETYEETTKRNRQQESYFYQKGATSKVYDVESSGLRELLENRQRNKGRSTDVKTYPSPIRKSEKPKVEAPVHKIETKSTSRVQQKETTSVQVSKRRFVPTNVPSPIYGFHKPSNINDLLSKKQDHVESEKSQLDVQQSVTETQNEQAIENQAQLEIEQTSKEIAATAEVIEVVEEASLPAENPTKSQITQEDKPKKVDESASLPIKISGNFILEIEEIDEGKIEERPIELKEELYSKVEDFPILIEETAEIVEEKLVNDEDVNDQATEHTELTLDSSPHVIVNPQIVEEKVEEVVENVKEENDEEPLNNVEVNEVQKGGILPFNVLMLKSDKEKYAAKLAQKQLQQHNDDIKGNSSHSNSIEKLINVAESDVDETQLAEEEKEQKTLQNENQTGSEPISDKQPVEIIQHENGLTPVAEIEEKPVRRYVKPSFDFLSPPEEKTQDYEWMESQADILVEALSHFQVTAQVESIMQGPAVTQFEITVGHGTKVSKIRNLADDLKLALAAKDIRIQAPIPGKSSIGIEIPNRISRAVQLSEVTNSESFIESESPLEAALGLDLTGKPVTIDLRKMPHGLIAGATGSGKSVCINSILVSLLYKADPHELKLMLIDPKMVELAPFNHIPHLVSPVITDVKAATAALKWAVEEMERRYQLFAHAGVRDLPRFNKLAESNGDYGHKLPYILIVIDELADLMMMSPADVEEAICRIAQKARACGIHLIVATQRPSVDVITGLIKSNIPTRIAFAVSSQVDSRTILDSQGAERLLGRGDMLYLGNGMSAPIRLQGTFVTDDEIEEIIEHVRGQGEPDYFFQQDELLKKTEMIEEQDELFEEVCRFVYEQGTASTSSIQRKYHIGYNRAARLIDLLEGQGFISEQRGSKPREVFITEADLSNLFD
ncbi:DNA translocase FtsK [Lysinibacillus sp. BW-2-10]|uniref:DNA translocase FtsK n=1 Tax=Lysinibacillus sp. BW-2-10 TaxID=2590030 RepID=UPI00117EF9AD|nr:DNA translocase FtsK [Lysinibacillus sp. BW-2-10]TSI03074.1 DNA translocase FtsK [Lysinibacillus sp. BW-2-10]